MNANSMLLGFQRTPFNKITNAELKQIANNIGCLAGMAQSINEVLGIGVDQENDAVNLAFSASLLAEIIGDLNGFMQSAEGSV